jgi:hypothetical protein
LSESPPPFKNKLKKFDMAVFQGLFYSNPVNSSTQYRAVHREFLDMNEIECGHLGSASMFPEEEDF